MYKNIVHKLALERKVLSIQFKLHTSKIMFTNKQISDGIQVIVDRYKAQGADFGISAMQKIPVNDISAAVFQEGDVLYLPRTKQEMDKVAFIAKINGNNAPAIPCLDANGTSRVLYLSTLRKEVLEYEQHDDGTVGVKRENGVAVRHTADTIDGVPNSLRKLVLSCGNMAQACDKLVGKVIRVKKISDPITTSRIITDPSDPTGRRRIASPTETRTTTVTVFEDVTDDPQYAVAPEAPAEAPAEAA